MGADQSQPENKSSRLKRDSPKLLSKHISRSKSAQGKSSFLRKSSQITSSTGHNIVVVKHAAQEESPDADSDLQKLKNIPTFLPIIPGTVSLPESRDPDVLERLDSGALCRYCVHYQEHLSKCASIVAKDQNTIFEDIKKVDAKSLSLAQSFIEQEKSIKKCSDRLNKISDISLNLSHCHYMLNQTVDALEKLNNSLPPEHRLEPFVWTTG